MKLLPLLVIVALLAFVAGRVTSGASADVPYAWVPLRASAFTSVATPRAEPVIPVASLTAREPDRTQLGVPHASVPPSRQRTVIASPASHAAAPHFLTGIASWGPFSGHVVTRLPRGTPIVVTGPLGTWRGLSWGYGPAKYTGRIADLDESVFAAICGPPSRGICTVTLRW